MKKYALIFALFTFVSIVATSQPQLTWRFANAEVINAGTQLQFDVEVMANTAGTYHRDLQVYFDYNTLAFGTDIAATVNVAPLALMNTHYVVVNTADNTSSKFAIITEAVHEMTQPGSAAHFNVVPTTFTGLLQFTIDILPGANTQLAGITFDAALMDGGQYYQSTSNTDPVKYNENSVYGDDLANLLLSSFYGSVLYARPTPVPLTQSTIELYQGATLIGSYATGSGSQYLITGMADGNYELKGTCALAHGGIQAVDAILIQRFIGNVISFTDLQKRSADVNKSNSVQNIDATFVRRRAGGIWPIAQWTAPDFVFDGPFGPPNGVLDGMPVNVSSGLGTIVIQALCSGDVNGSYVP